MTVWDLTLPGATAMHASYQNVINRRLAAKADIPAKPTQAKVRKLRRQLSETQNHRCAQCGIRFSDDMNSRSYGTIEHFIPRIYGGPWSWLNLAMTCVNCNEARAISCEEVIDFFES